jgi:quercetin dioxygenase-like cupin family protein
MEANVVQNLMDLTQIPQDGILSRTLFQDEHVKVVLFGYAAGQELSEHTAAMPAELLFLSGAASVKLGDKVVDAQAGTFVHMPAQLPHSITTLEPTLMLLTLLKSAR